jgi:membrane associated rhomboid family serine protease
MQQFLKYKIWNLIPFVVVMWAVEIADALYFDSKLDNYGIRPRNLQGLWGILFAPFLHGDFEHLMANTVPLIILGSLILFRSVEEFWLATLLIMGIGGGGVWVFGEPGSFHVGSSILIFGYIGYLLLRGYLENSSNGVLISILVLVFYGGTLAQGVLPTDAGVSWEGHLFGCIGGLLAAHAVSKA